MCIRDSDQTIPLVGDSGFDPIAIIKEQGERTGRTQGFIFPYDGRSVGAAFRRVCRDLSIEDLSLIHISEPTRPY